ncbi:hypothetical protein [Salinispora mooreana]|uniref:hypothetical protein n=1 Tax=Salinispora mooreana TaxID=999545 RepID=UPI0004AE1D19|nr:hypothetical protein [Salinispora mooreana]
MTTTYLTQAAMEQVNHAQVELERHLVTSIAGRCLTCRQIEPCSGRATAEATFARYGRLPRRRPGMTTVNSTASTWTWFTRPPGDR